MERYIQEFQLKYTINWKIMNLQQINFWRYLFMKRKKIIKIKNISEGSQNIDFMFGIIYDNFFLIKKIQVKNQI